MRTPVAAIAIALAAAGPVAAQTSERPTEQTPQRTNLPPGGLILDFKEIDRNNDRVISVEEWNDFIATLRSRTAERGSSGGAAAGATGGASQPKR